MGGGDVFITNILSRTTSVIVELCNSGLLVTMTSPVHLNQDIPGSNPMLIKFVCSFSWQ